MTELTDSLVRVCTLQEVGSGDGEVGVAVEMRNAVDSYGGVLVVLTGMPDSSKQPQLAISDALNRGVHGGVSVLEFPIPDAGLEFHVRVLGFNPAEVTEAPAELLTTLESAALGAVTGVLRACTLASRSRED